MFVLSNFLEISSEAISQVYSHVQVLKVNCFKYFVHVFSQVFS